MENLQLPHAKLLYFVSELWKQKAISDIEKSTIKGTRDSLSFSPLTNSSRNDHF